jgi:hypothetical protein
MARLYIPKLHIDTLHYTSEYGPPEDSEKSVAKVFEPPVPPD